MCKINMITYFYYVNVCKHEHEKNIARLWCKIVLKTNVEQIERNNLPTSIYTFLGTQHKEASKEASMCALNKEVS